MGSITVKADSNINILVVDFSELCRSDGTGGAIAPPALLLFGSSSVVGPSVFHTFPRLCYGKETQTKRELRDREIIF